MPPPPPRICRHDRSDRAARRRRCRELAPAVASSALVAALCAALLVAAGSRGTLLAAACAALAAAGCRVGALAARRRTTAGALPPAPADRAADGARGTRAPRHTGRAGSGGQEPSADGLRDGDTSRATGTGAGTGQHRDRTGDTREPGVLWRLRATLADVPGSLGRVCTALAGVGADIVTLQTHPLADAAVDEFLLRAPARLTAATLARTVTDAGGRDAWLEHADAHALVDPPTRMLALAARTARDPAQLPLALRESLGHCTVRHTPHHAQDGRPYDEPGGPYDESGRATDEEPHGGWETGDGHGRDAAAGLRGDDVLEPTVMRLRTPAGGTLTLRRDHLPFTPAEFARARALVALAARPGAHAPEGRTALDPPGGGVTIRPAGPDDLPAALALHARCSPETLARRYHGPVGDADRFLRHLLTPRFGMSLAAQTPAGRLAALGHLLRDGDEGEVTLLVEDAWQHRGIGVALVRGLVELAAQAGLEAVYAVTAAADTPVVAALRGLGLPLEFQADRGALVVCAALPRAPGRDAPSLDALPWVAARRR